MRMKHLFAILISLVLSLPCFGVDNYYVDKDGNDGNGGLAWGAGNSKLTIAAAYALCATGVECVVHVGEGTYAEGDYLTCGAVAGGADAQVTIVGEASSPSGVVITGAGAYAVVVSSAIADTSSITFEDLTITAGAAAGIAVYYSDTTSTLTFDNVDINASVVAGADGIKTATTVGSRNLIVENGCAIAALDRGIEVTAATLTVEDSTVTTMGGYCILQNVTQVNGYTRLTDSTFAGNGVYLAGYGPGALVEGCTFTSNLAAGALPLLQVGIDGARNATPFTQPPVVFGNSFTFSGASVSHCILIGAGARGAVASYNATSGGNLGIVAKSDAVTIHHNQVCSPVGIALKGATDSHIYNNSVYGVTSGAFGLDVGNVTLTTCAWTDATNTVTHASLAGYEWSPGDYLRVTAGATLGYYEILSKSNDSAITIVTDEGIAVGDDADFDATLYALSSRNRVTHNIFMGGSSAATIRASFVSGDYTGRDNWYDHNIYWNSTAATNDNLMTIDGTTKKVSDGIAGIQALWAASYLGTLYARCDQHSTVIDPYFKDVSNNDLRIQNNSPAKGTQTGTPSLATWNDLGAWQRLAGPGTEGTTGTHGGTGTDGATGVHGSGGHK